MTVSLFTREWIEISTFPEKIKFPAVSLFTREWIEISVNASTFTMTDGVSLFTREWIEIIEG